MAIAFIGSAMAVLPGKSIEFAGGEAGKVIFKGDTHGAKQGMKCNDCHPKPWATKKGSFKMTKEDHGKTDYCGKCHDGQKAFSQSTEADCGKCHMKAEEAPASEEKPISEEKPAPAVEEKK
ncbi:MAG: hypothetical protein HXY53_06740 [Nitrospirae bacterium]|nr:hypothetical protein [Nitrospirota bacterium]